jgi:hypothetical protein
MAHQEGDFLSGALKGVAAVASVATGGASNILTGLFTGGSSWRGHLPRGLAFLATVRQRREAGFRFLGARPEQAPD